MLCGPGRVRRNVGEKKDFMDDDHKTCQKDVKKRQRKRLRTAWRMFTKLANTIWKKRLVKTPKGCSVCWWRLILQMNELDLRHQWKHGHFPQNFYMLEIYTISRKLICIFELVDPQKFSLTKKDISWNQPFTFFTWHCVVNNAITFFASNQRFC